ncbi:cellulose biosynthesis cyclic di-GMP-binding regulatory protein BcsB [Bacillus sp. JJ722]|uniref:cellulose biosynthesis cyclic di-GMP-binding regulatory protein BcsB n=1 Tax=Bacillus sp. JJ722 TaxID=3122973 RepID=UPI002FFE6665
MRKYLMMTLFFATVLFMSVISYGDVAKASSQIEIEGINIGDTSNLPKRQVVTNSPIELFGPKAEVKLNYQLISNATGNNNQLVLKIKHSELLIEPSSITISIDGQTITSKPLHEGNVNSDLTIPLTGNALKKGAHSVTVSFYGVIKEGVCVDQNTSGNWLTIGIDSYFQLNGQMNEETQALKDYPRSFIGTEKNPVYIVIPDQSSTETLNSGLMVATYLAEQTNEKDTIQVVRESNLRKIQGNIIFLGAKSEFDSPFMKNLLTEAELPDDPSFIILSRHKLMNGNKSSEALIVTADKSKNIQDRIKVLTNNQLNTQLSGRQMSISKMPVIKETEDLSRVSLKKFGMESMVLDSERGQSQHYYYYVPFSQNPNDNPSLHLQLKRSETIPTINENNINEEIELVVLVNDVPHSVNIRSLSKEENGVYNVNLPIKEDAIKENGLIDLQFVSNGLREKNPCVTADENRWIYISNDSFFQFNSDNKGNEVKNTLAGYPTSFVGNSKATTIVLPNNKQIEDKQLLQLYRSLSINSQLSDLTLKRANEIKKENVNNENVIFIGGPKVQPLLNDVKDQLIIPYDNDAPQLSEFGFITETIKSFSWIQPNPWSKEQNNILVFDRTKQDAPYLEESFLNNLRNLNEDATVAVNTLNNQTFTNAAQFEKETGKELEPEEKQEKSIQFSIWWIISIVALLILVSILIFVIQKRKKKE